MGIVRRYRLVSLSLLVVSMLALFLGFFFVFVLAPVVVIGLFYVVYLAAEERLSYLSSFRDAIRLRRLTLAREAEARRTLVARRARRRERSARRG